MSSFLGNDCGIGQSHLYRSIPFKDNASALVDTDGKGDVPEGTPALSDRITIAIKSKFPQKNLEYQKLLAQAMLHSPCHELYSRLDDCVVQEFSGL